MSSASTIKKNFISLRVFSFILLEGENVGDEAYLSRGVGRREAGLEGGLLGCCPESGVVGGSAFLARDGVGYDALFVYHDFDYNSTAFVNSVGG